MTPGGFRKIYYKGAWFPDCRHLASGFSATSLATLATGAWPAQHGIVADSWYDRASKTRVHASEESLLAETLLADAVESRTRVSVVSMDAAHARIFAGSADADLYWMDERGQFQTNGTSPDWVKPFNDRTGLDKLRDARWIVPGVRADAPPLRTLTYDANHPQQFFNLYRASPYAQDAQFDFVSELIAHEGLGQKSTTDILCVLCGSMELLGYETGGRSALMDQMVLQFDRRLETLLAQLSHSPGDAAFNLALVAGHGAPDAPPDAARARMAVDGESVAHRVEAALAAHGMGHVEKFLYPFLYLDSSGFRDPEEIRKAAAAAALDHPAVADYYTAGGASSVHNGWLRRFHNSFHPKRSGDVMISYRPGYVEDFGQGRGVSYGSLYNYDAIVPLGFYGPQFRAGVFEGAVESVDLAPTLARLLGQEPPSSATGRVLAEALA